MISKVSRYYINNNSSDCTVLNNKGLKWAHNSRNDGRNNTTLYRLIFIYKTCVLLFLYIHPRHSLLITCMHLHLARARHNIAHIDLRHNYNVPRHNTIFPRVWRHTHVPTIAWARHCNARICHNYDMRQARHNKFNIFLRIHDSIRV